MALQIVTIPCLRDNYAYLAHDEETGATAVVDVPEATPILDALAERGWTLGQIFITHHHHDHVGGLAEVRDATEATVIGPAAEAAKMPALDQTVVEGDPISIGAETGEVIDVRGHTLGHVAFHIGGAAFTADSLMAAGCGRLTEGTAEMLHGSLQKLAALDPKTVICSGHEYTETNVKFALTVDGSNPALQARADEVLKKRANGEACVPTLLSEELATNPFLRCDDPAIRAGLGMESAPDVEVFAEIRARKDRF